MPSAPSILMMVTSTFYAFLGTLMSVTSKPSDPGKSSSRIVTLLLVSSPLSLSGTPESLFI